MLGRRPCLLPGQRRGAPITSGALDKLGRGGPAGCDLRRQVDVPGDRPARARQTNPRDRAMKTLRDADGGSTGCKEDYAKTVNLILPTVQRAAVWNPVGWPVDATFKRPLWRIPLDIGSP